MKKKLKWKSMDRELKIDEMKQKKKEMKTRCSMCFTSVYHEQAFIVALVEENEPGYKPCYKYGTFMTDKDAQDKADDLNADLGMLYKMRNWEIVASSIRAQNEQEMERLRRGILFTYRCSRHGCERENDDMSEKEMLQHFHETKHCTYDMIVDKEA